MSEMEGKDLVLKADDTAIKLRRPKPRLIALDNGKLVSSDGRFHTDLAAQYLRQHARREWVPVGQLARVFCGANTISGKMRVRKNAASVFRELLENGEFLLYETGRNGRIESVKLFDGESSSETYLCKPQIERMQRSRDLTQTKVARAIAVFELKVAAARANTQENP